MVSAPVAVLCACRTRRAERGTLKQHAAGAPVYAHIAGRTDTSPARLSRAAPCIAYSAGFAFWLCRKPRSEHVCTN